jgi:hypothetical protein
MKAKLTYAVRETLAPGETNSTLVPVIIDRAQPVDLATIIENCIDRNLILGAKGTAAQGIAEGIAEQIYKEFTKGNGVAFGSYFYGRLYLNGTTTANGTLSDENKVNVRLMKGDAFKLTLSDFSLSFDGNATAPKINFVANFGDGGNNTRGEVVNGAKVAVNGSNLFSAGDTDVVEFTEVGAESPTVVSVSAFDSVSTDQLTFSCPALTSGKSYDVVVKRTDANGVTRTTSSKRVTASGTPAPSLTVTGVHNEETEPPAIYVGRSLLFDGTGLDAWGDGDRIEVKRLGDGETDWESITGTDDVTVTPSDGMLWVSTDWWSAISFGVEDGIQIRFRVTIGGTSAEVNGTVHEE